MRDQAFNVDNQKGNQMNMIILPQNRTMSSKDLLEVINQVRQGMGEPLLRLNSFNAKIEDELDGENYTKNVVQNSNNTESVIFELTLEQCMLIGMRESKSVRRHVMQKLKALEAGQPRELSRREILQLALAAEEENQALKEQVALLEPKAQVVDAIADTTSTFTIRDTAKTIGVPEKTLVQFILDKRWVYRENSKHRRLCAYSTAIEKGLMVNKVTSVISYEEGDHVYTQARVTAKGLTRLTAMIEKAGLKQ